MLTANGRNSDDNQGHLHSDSTSSPLLLPGGSPADQRGTAKLTFSAFQRLVRSGNVTSSLISSAQMGIVLLVRAERRGE
jgi:hypothetical protein